VLCIINKCLQIILWTQSFFIDNKNEKDVCVVLEIDCDDFIREECTVEDIQLNLISECLYFL